MTTRRAHLERAILLVGQAAQEIARSPAGDAIEADEREKLIGQIEVIAHRLKDVIEGDIS